MLPLPIDKTSKLESWNARALYAKASQFFKTGQWELAASLFHYLCIHLPDFKQARFKLSICQMQLKLWSKAQQHLELLLDTQVPDADYICNLAICHWQQRHIKSALRLFYYNLKQFPHHQNTLENLASLFLQFNRSPQAIILYKQILGINENRYDIRFNLAACLQQQAIYDEAIMHYQILLVRQQQHPDYLYNLGSIYYNLGQTKACRYYWQQSLKMKPNQKSLQFMLNLLDEKAFDPSSHQHYVEELFNSYAVNYDQHLMNQLNYQLPKFLSYYLKKTIYINILDVGCGTGLCGESLRGNCHNLIGIDLSQAMLNQAEKKKIYHELIASDVHQYLKNTPKQFDLIVAMDVIPYISDLEQLFKLMIKKLHSNGEILVSFETNSSEFQRLETTGRISYQKEYIEKICHDLSLDIISEKQIVARTQANLPVMERIFHLKRNF